jgi:hypothetical protein
VHIRANIVGPPDVAIRIKASIAAFHSFASCSTFGSLVMYLPALATARQRYRIIKPTLPAAISHWVGPIWAAAQSSVSPLPRPAWPSMHHIPECRGAAVYLMAGHLSRAV